MTLELTEVIERAWRDCLVFEQARATRRLISALDAAGYAVVPKEPTRKMDEAGDLAGTGWASASGIYRAMIAARPK